MALICVITSELIFSKVTELLAHTSIGRSLLIDYGLVFFILLSSYFNMIMLLFSCVVTSELMCSKIA